MDINSIGCAWDSFLAEEVDRYMTEGYLEYVDSLRNKLGLPDTQEAHNLACRIASGPSVKLDGNDDDQIPF